MPPTVIGSHFPLPEIGVSFRRQSPGPEQELIDWFLDQHLLEVPPGCRVTVFREPRLDSGFPDLVLVMWDEDTTRNWSPLRAELTKYDIRVMHYIVQVGCCPYAELKRLFTRRAATTLERLEAADLVHREQDTCFAPVVSEAFAARCIVAIEAKVSEWTAVLDQALVNTWFASHSYILIPRLPRAGALLGTARQLGIGVLAKEDTARHDPPLHSHALPRSYASWLFNEWAWRVLQIEEGPHP